MPWLAVGVTVLIVAVGAVLGGWWWLTRLPRDQSVSESWLTIHGRDYGKKGGSR